MLIVLSQNLCKLKLIDLSGSKNLTQTPDFNEFPNIERLNFQGCTRLRELHLSVGGLERLTQLNLKDCIYLKNLPRQLNLKSLQTLILSGCSKLKKFPQIGRNMTSLSKLYLDGTAIEELPLSIKRLTGLTLLNLQECKNLLSFPSVICSLTSLEILTLSSCVGQPPKQALSYTYLRSLICSTLVLWRYCFFIPEPKPISLLLPKSFSGLSSLVSLDLSDCNLLDGALPDDLSRLSSLKSLNMSKNNFTLLHDGISLLAKLKLLYLDHCIKLQTLPHLPLSTQFVSARGCTSLENYSNQVVVWTSGEERFTIINCLGLADDEDGKIAEVSSLDIHFQPLWLWQRYVEVSLSLSHTHTHTHIAHLFTVVFLIFYRTKFFKLKAFVMFYVKVKFQSGLAIRILGHLHQSHYLLISSVIEVGKESLSVSFLQSLKIRTTVLPVRIQNTFMNFFVVWS